MSHTKYSLWQFLHDLARYIRPYRGKFWLGVFFRFTSDLIQLYPAWALSQLVVLLTKHFDAQTGQTIVLLLIGWLGAALYNGTAQELAKYLGYQVAEQASLDLSYECLAHIFRLDFAWQEIENSGNKLTRIDHGHDGVNEIIRRIFDVLIEVFVNTVGIVLIFFSLNKTLSIALIFYIITYYIIGTYLLKKAMRQERRVSALTEDLGGLVFESLNNMQTIKSLGIDRGIMGSVTTKMTSLVKEIRKRIFYYRSQSGVLSVYEDLFGLAAVVFICWEIIHGQYTASLLILFIGLYQKVSESTRELKDVTQQVVISQVWVSRAMEILRTEPQIENQQKQLTQVEYPSDWQTLNFHNLHFQYEKNQVLENVDLTISRGEKIGVVGLSGAGKSTLFKLLLDLYEDYDGEICLDQTPLKNIRRQTYIDHVSAVLQDTELFNMSLRENIMIAGVEGREVSETKFQEILQTAHLLDVIEHLPKGLDTLVGEKGIKLSGGQRQRVGIARALYRQPDILLFDEATSHLDVHSEKQIQQSLHECFQQFTTIVIAHRLSTIKEMDRIVVLQKGTIVEQGSFVALLKHDGVFAEMWREQKL